MNYEVGGMYKLISIYSHMTERWEPKNSLVLVTKIKSSGSWDISLKWMGGAGPVMKHPETLWMQRNIELIPHDVVGELNEL